LSFADITKPFSLVVNIEHHLTVVVDTLRVTTVRYIEKMGDLVYRLLEKTRVNLAVIFRQTVELLSDFVERNDPGAGKDISVSENIVLFGQIEILFAYRKHLLAAIGLETFEFGENDEAIVLISDNIVSLNGHLHALENIDGTVEDRAEVGSQLIYNHEIDFAKGNHHYFGLEKCHRFSHAYLSGSEKAVIGAIR
jgi:hypothetical protein